MNARFDENYRTTMLGVSSVDLETPVTIAANPVTGAVLIDKSPFDAEYVNVSGDTMTGRLTVPNLTLGTETGVIHGLNGDLFADNVIEDEITLSDVTTNNATTLKHGFLPKLSGSATQYLNGAGNYVTISGTGVPSGYGTTTFSGQTSINVVHNFGIKPLVQVLISNSVTIPYTITHNTDNDFTVTFTSSQSGTIIASAGSPPLSNITTTATDYTVTNNDNIVEVTAFNKTVTLPTAVGITGKTFSIANKSTGDIFVVGTGGQTIFSEVSQTVPTQSTMVVYSDGTNYGIT